MQTERTDPEVDRLARRVREEHRRMRVAMVERGLARRELPNGVDPEFVVDLVTAPVITRALRFGESVDATYVDRVLDVVLTGAAACASGGER